MAVRLSALRAGSPLRPRRFLALISVRGWVDPRTILRLEGLGKLKKIQWPHRESNPRPSGLWHSASTNYATACRWKPGIKSKLTSWARKWVLVYYIGASHAACASIYYKDIIFLSEQDSVTCTAFAWLIIRRGFGLDNWIYCTSYIYTVRDYRQLQRYRWSTHFRVHRGTRTTILSLH
jgi:hypothetical protein